MTTTGSHRLDWIPKGTVRPSMEFFDTEQAAKVAEWRLKFAGVTYMIRWFDSAVYA